MAKLPQEWDQIQPDVQLILDTITGKRELDFLPVAAAATEIIQYVLHLLGADVPPLIGGATVETLSAAEWTALNDCLELCPEGPAKGGFLASLAIQRILKELVKQLGKFLEMLLESRETKVPLGELWDGTILRILLENLPQIIAAILALISKDEK